MRHRQISPEYENLKKLKERLFKIRLQISQDKKSKPWTNRDIEKALKSLKNNKAQDADGLVFELFKDAAGKDLKLSLTILCNKIKEELEIPAFMKKTNITSIWKQKGSKLDINNERGLFNVSKLRSLVDKLIYNDYYNVIENNMTDSNSGARKSRNIRDNLFIAYGIINFSITNNISLDIVLFDVEFCFDSMWYEETMNDLWNCEVKDDKFAILAKMNEIVDIAIKTDAGESERFELEKI